MCWRHMMCAMTLTDQPGSAAVQQHCGAPLTGAGSSRVRLAWGLMRCHSLQQQWQQQGTAGVGRGAVSRWVSGAVEVCRLCCSSIAHQQVCCGSSGVGVAAVSVQWCLGAQCEHRGAASSPCAACRYLRHHSSKLNSSSSSSRCSLEQRQHHLLQMLAARNSRTGSSSSRHLRGRPLACVMSSSRYLKTPAGLLCLVRMPPTCPTCSSWRPWLSASSSSSTSSCIR